jgi:hypothetical protein
MVLSIRSFVRKGKATYAFQGNDVYLEGTDGINLLLSGKEARLFTAAVAIVTEHTSIEEAIEQLVDAFIRELKDKS